MGSTLRHLLQDSQTYNTNVRRSESPCECCHEWRHDVSPFSWAAELRPSQDCCEPHSFPSSPLLHDWLRATHLTRLAAIPCSHCSRVDPADVRRKKHDVRS